MCNISFQYDVFQQSKKKNDVNGDGVFIYEFEKYTICSVVDGLGSGKGAYESTQAIGLVLTKYEDTLPLATLILKCNEAMRLKRGVVLAMLYIDRQARSITYCSVGNVACYFFNKANMYIPKSHYGYLAGKRLTPVIEKWMYEKGDRCFLHTDGLEIIRPTELQKRQVWENLKKNQTTTNMMYKNDDITYVMMEF